MFVLLQKYLFIHGTTHLSIVINKKNTAVCQFIFAIWPMSWHSPTMDESQGPRQGTYASWD